MRILLIILLSMTMLAGCADTRPAQEPEGSVAFRSGTGDGRNSQTYTVPGPVLKHVGILTPAYEPVWQSAWVSKDPENSLSQGATAGLSTSLVILQIAPIALTFWPVAAGAAGVVIGAAVLGMLGGGQEDPSLQRISPPDRTVITEATRTLRPDRLFRESMTAAMAHRMRGPLPVVTWQQGWGADTAGTDPLAEARAQGMDGVLDFAVDAIGLAAGEEKDTFGVFVQVRVRALEARDGTLRYERVLSYGPGQPVEGLPRSDFHTVELLAMDKATLYRYLASQAIERMARLVTEDPDLPLESR
jgi:hypothetical protein